jgi:hypothetical protein
VYQKEADELPRESYGFRRKAKRGIGPKMVENIDKNKFITTSSDLLPMEQYNEIQGIDEIEVKLEEFHFAAKELLKNRDISADQLQLFLYDDQRESDRITDFVRQFYSGDINNTIAKAIEYYYINKLQSQEDREKLKIMADNVMYIPPKTKSKRKGLDEPTPSESGNEKSKDKGAVQIKIEGELGEQIKTAKEILGDKNVIDNIKIEQAFGIKVDTVDIPKIPFSRIDLERAKELNQFLILRVDKDSDGKPLTMKGVKDTLETRGYKEELDKTGKVKGKILASDSYDSKFFTEDPIKMQWALVSKEVVTSSTSKNYLEQTKEIKNHLQTAVFKDKAIPKEYQEAIVELDNYIKTNFKGKSEAEIQKILGGKDWQKYTKELSELKINQLCRHTPAEILYDIMAYFQTTGERLYEKMYTRTKRLDSDGYLVIVGDSDAAGAIVDGNGADGSDDDLGVSLSRSI